MAFLNFSKKKQEKKPEAPPKPSFSISTEQPVINLPEMTSKERVNVRYTLIPNYAYAHIFFDPAKKELIYKVEEPELDEKEKKARPQPRYPLV